MINKISFTPRAIKFTGNNNPKQQQVQQPVARRTEVSAPKSDYEYHGFVSYLSEKFGDFCANQVANRYPAQQQRVMRAYNTVNDYRANSNPITNIRYSIARNFREARENYFIQEQITKGLYSNPYFNPTCEPIYSKNPENPNLYDVTLFRTEYSRNYLSDSAYSTTVPSGFFTKAVFGDDGKIIGAQNLYDFNSKLFGLNYIDNGSNLHYDELHIMQPEACSNSFNFSFASALGCPLSMINVNATKDAISADYLVTYNYDSVKGIKTTRTYVKPVITYEKKIGDDISFTIHAQQVLDSPYRRANRGNEIQYLTNVTETYATVPPTAIVESNTAIELRNNENTSTSYENYYHDLLRGTKRGPKTVARIFDVQDKK